MMKKNINMMSAVLKKPSGSTGISLASQDVRGEIKFLTIDQIVPYKNQSRTVFDEDTIAELADSIRSQGVIQPLQVVPSLTNPGKFEVVSGERRLKAASVVSLERVPCIILDSKKDSDLVALIENIQREDLHPVDLANSIGCLVEKANHGDKSKIAIKIGMGVSLFSQYIAVSNLPDNIKEELLKIKDLPFYKALNLTKLQTEEEMRAAIETPQKERKQLSLLHIKMRGGEFQFDVHNRKQITSDIKAELKRQLTSFIDSL